MSGRLSSVEIIGAGPAGLYSAILIRRMLPHVRIRVTEENPKGATFGFGVVFSDQALDFMEHDDPYMHRLIQPEMERWQTMTLNLPDEQIVLDGLGFSAIGRKRLLEILGARTESLGVEVHYESRIGSLDVLESDLIIGADGLNSIVRQSCEDAFKPSIEYQKNNFAWFGVELPFNTLSQTFINTECGAFNAHHYRYSPSMSTFIVECGSDTFNAYGFAEMDEHESAKTCSEVFKDVLEGAALVTNKSVWRRFPRLWCDSWFTGNRVIIGDAAHTAHFSIGSGTRLAMEDAIALVKQLQVYDNVDDAISAYDASRRPIVEKIVSAANSSADWYDRFEEKMALPPMEFALEYLRRSGRMSLDRVRQISPKFMDRYERYKQ